MTPTILRPLTERLTPEQMAAARAVLERRGLRSNAQRDDLLSLMMCISECDTDVYVAVAFEVRKAVENAE